MPISFLLRATLATPFAALLLAAPSDPPHADLDSLVESERSFARRCLEKGIKTSFLDFLAEDSVVFRPQPVPGRRRYERAPDSTARLAWEPAFAEISSSGDLGYTTGPWSLQDEDGSPPLHGHYVSVWGRHPSEGWKVLLDVGITHPASAGAVGGVETPPVPDDPTVAADETLDDPRKARAILRKAERSLARAAAEKGFAAAAEPLLAPDARLYREGEPPAVGEAAQRLLALEAAPADHKVLGGRVSASGDLGYTYGVQRLVADEGSGEPPSRSFVRIWRRSPAGEWRIALDVALPHGGS